MTFLLLDRILQLEAGVSIVAERHIRNDETYFEDHFPGFPVVPGVLLTEMMGQAAAKCLLAAATCAGKPMLASIQDAKFRQWTRPGDRVELRATITQHQPRFASAAGQAWVGEQLVASTKLLFTFIAMTQVAANPRDTVLETYLATHPV
jgi:3-hydroxyacyl-[acyl-carrier-protein] dehydratase